MRLMAQESDRQNVRIPFEPAATVAFLHRVRSELEKKSVAAVTIDMGAVEQVDPAALRTLLTAGDTARDAGKDIFLDRVGTTVYKSLQLAKLGVLFKRLQ
jgi:anti-anti-sigma regulatory factor